MSDRADHSDPFLEPLEGLTSLQRLYLKDAQVSADSVARLLAALPDLKFSQ